MWLMTLQVDTFTGLWIQQFTPYFVESMPDVNFLQNQHSALRMLFPLNQNRTFCTYCIDCPSVFFSLDESHHQHLAMYVVENAPKFDSVNPVAPKERLVLEFKRRPDQSPPPARPVTVLNVDEVTFFRTEADEKRQRLA